MAIARLSLPRLEGQVSLEQQEQGDIRLLTPRSRGLEAQLLNRSPQDAVFLVQRLSADSGASHALAAVLAWEHILGLSVTHNGVLLRDLLHVLSFLHGHLRQFYLLALPDYFPPSLLTNYRGERPELRRLAAALVKQQYAQWARHRFAQRFSGTEVEEILLHSLEAQRVLAVLQRMLAVLGGKFPMVMTIVPGGMTPPVTEQTILRLQAYLAEVREFLSDTPLSDGRKLLERYTEVRALGRGGDALLSAGSLGENAGPGAALFPRGVYLGQKLEPLSGKIDESVRHAFYRFPGKAAGARQVQPDPARAGAYSWIKAPRYNARAAETGAIARLTITYLAGARSQAAPAVVQVQQQIGLPIHRANTVGGRMLARLAEMKMLVQYCAEILEQLVPGQPSAADADAAHSATGEGRAAIEAPAGAVQHRMVLDRGRVTFYDIIAPSTWNGSPMDNNGRPGPLEQALASTAPDLGSTEGQLTASRIVHSFFFSATDAVQ